MDLFWERVHMPDWHGYDRVRPFLTSFLCVVFSQHKPAVSAEPPGDIHPFIQWALTEGCFKEAPTMTWMMMFPPKFLLKLGSQCHQITFRKRRCQRGFIPHRVCRRQLAKVLSSCPMRTQRFSFWEVVIAGHRFESMEQPSWIAVLVMSWLEASNPLGYIFCSL